MERFVVILQLTMPVECFSPRSRAWRAVRVERNAPKAAFKGIWMRYFHHTLRWRRSMEDEKSGTILRLSIASNSSQLGFWQIWSGIIRRAQDRNSIATDAKPTVRADCAR